VEDLKAAAWYKQAFDLRGLGKRKKPATTKPLKHSSTWTPNKASFFLKTPWRIQLMAVKE
jgi:hypothetical protein